MHSSIEVIYEDKDIVVINKPSGVLVHSAKSHEAAQEYTVASWALRHYPEMKAVGDEPETRPGIVHRLDKETSGVLVLAKNQESFLYLKNLFKIREIKKTYLAIVKGILKEEMGTIALPIGFQKNGTLKRSTRSPKDAKEAITDYEVREVFENATLLAAMPRTGRTHQIRVHLKSIGHSILGDVLYGGKKQKDSASRVMLHALSIEFVNKDGKRLKLEAAPPDDFLGIIHKLEAERSDSVV